MHRIPTSAASALETSHYLGWIMYDIKQVSYNETI
jgi:hypothetical protein